MKYKITNEKHPKFNIYRIQALKDFEDVSAGQVGGFIENESNLSQDGNCWVYDNASAFGSAYVLVGCFYGTLDEFHRRIYTDGNYTDRTLPPHRKQYLGFIKMIERWEREKCI